jgi:hypothetical protein
MSYLSPVIRGTPVLSTTSLSPHVVVTPRSEIIVDPIITSDIVIDPIVTSTLSSPVMTTFVTDEVDLSNIITTTDNPVVVTTTDTIISPSYIVTPDRVLLSPTVSTVSVGKHGTHKLSVDLTLSDPVLSTYYDLNTDPKIHNKVAKYFYYKILDKWLLGSLKDLLGYVTVKGGKARLTRKKSSKDSQKVIEKKIKFLEDKVFTFRDVLKILRRVVNEDNIKWVDLYKKTYSLKKVFRTELANLFESKIKGRR